MASKVWYGVETVVDKPINIVPLSELTDAALVAIQGRGGTIQAVTLGTIGPTGLVIVCILYDEPDGINGTPRTD
jgi:hypothetical protein